jgi:HEPN domain-containing protein
MLRQSDIAPRSACYFAQQAAEKALKGAICFAGDEPPYVHNLNVLRNRLPDDWSTRAEHPALGLLTVWGVDSRYPTIYDEATIEDAESAVAQAQSVYDSVARDIAERRAKRG